MRRTLSDCKSHVFVAVFHIRCQVYKQLLFYTEIECKRKNVRTSKQRTAKRYAAAFLADALHGVTMEHVP